jgi:hypothetical protein
MPNTCTICRHDERAGIETLMARRKPLRDIAGQFRVSKSAVKRHQDCIVDALTEAQRRREIESAVNVDEEIKAACATLKRLRDACEEWLADPDRPDKFTLDARSGEIMVIYEELEAGAQKPRRKRGNLGALLERIEKNLSGVSVERVESKYADPRQLIINTMRQMTAQLDVIAKLQGLYKQPETNPNDARRQDERIEAVIKGLMQLRGLSRDEAEAQVKKVQAESQEWVM